MKKWKIWTGLTAIFLSGIVVGFVLGGAHARKSVENLLTGDYPRPYSLIVNRINRELGLTESQRAHVENIVCRAQAEMFKIRQSHRPEVERIIADSMAEMKTQLTEEQGRKLDALHEKAQKRWGRWKNGSGKEGDLKCD